MSRSELVLKAFLSRSPPEKRRALERFLPEHERLLLAKLPVITEPSSGFPKEEMLENVHWSWFLPTLKSYSTREQRLFLSALSPLAAEQLSQALSLRGPLEEISSPAQIYLRKQLFHSLVGPHERLLPIDYLPASPLNRLLSLTKKELTRLIDRLSLYDLAVEMRQIVETKILKKIYSFLTEEQKSALKKMAAPKATTGFPRLGLDRWDGKEESLKILLHRRGLARLGLALSGQDPDLIWLLCHQLDIGRGGQLLKLCAKEATPKVTDAIIRQIKDLL